VTIGDEGSAITVILSTSRYRGAPTRLISGASIAFARSLVINASASRSLHPNCNSTDLSSLMAASPGVDSDFSKAHIVETYNISLLA
jgi:hypothetical protein